MKMLVAPRRAALVTSRRAVLLAPRRAATPVDCLGAALVVCLCAALVACGGGTSRPSTTNGGQPAPDPLVLISLDGFRWDYPQLTDTPALDALAAAGVSADSLIPVFPSKTFPCHWALITGLYPAHNGVVSNNMRDPAWGGEFHIGDPQLTDPRWWQGEPIWTTAHHHGLRTASFFWPGSDVLVGGDRPDHFYPYDGSIPFEERVEQVLAWLDLPAGERPSFITLYFAEPNDTAHDDGPESPEALEQVRRVDAMVGLLVDGLRRRGRLASTNLVVTADHGMTQMDPSRVVLLDDLVELEPGEVFEQGAFLQIYPQAGREETIFATLAGADPHLAVYRNAEIPERYRLAGNPRLAPIVGIPEVGWAARTRADMDDGWDGFLLGDHGGDPQHPDMQAIFIAAGPAFAHGARVPSFDSIEIYDLLARALGIEPAPNDGDLSHVEGVLAPRLRTAVH